MRGIHFVNCVRWDQCRTTYQLFFSFKQFSRDIFLFGIWFALILHIKHSANAETMLQLARDTRKTKSSEARDRQILYDILINIISIRNSFECNLHCIQFTTDIIWKYCRAIEVTRFKSESNLSWHVWTRNIILKLFNSQIAEIISCIRIDRLEIGRFWRVPYVFDMLHFCTQLHTQHWQYTYTVFSKMSE